MTRSELTGTRELFFSGWIREALPDSSTGFMVTDLDFLLYNYKTKKIMFIEVKTRGSDAKTWQKMLFKNINDWVKKGIDEDWKYCGYHIIQFENTNFTDGKVYFDYKEISEDKLKEILSFN